MASFHEQGCTSSDVETKPVSACTIAEWQKAALAEIDNAKLS